MILATANDDMDVSAANYGKTISYLLEAYHKDLGGKDVGVPKSTLETATPLHDSAAKEAAPGPAEAASGHVPAALSVSAALIDSSHTSS